MHTLGLLFLVPITMTGALAAEMLAPVMDLNLVLGFDAGPDNFYNAPVPPWVAGATPGWYYGPNPQNYPGLWALHDFMCRFLSYYPDALQCPTENIMANYNPKPPVKTSTTVKTTTTVKTSTKTKTTVKTSTKTTTTVKTSIKTTTATKTAIITETKFTTATIITTIATPTITPTPVPTNGYTQTFSNITAAVQADDYMTFGLVETVSDCMAMCNSVPGCTFVNSYHDVNGKGGSTELTCSLFKQCHTAADADNAGGQSQPNGSIDFIINSDGWCQDGSVITTTTSSKKTTSSTAKTTSTAKSTAHTTSTSPTTKPKTTTAPARTPAPVPHYAQCGGIGYHGSETCVRPYKCIFKSRFYSQCL